MLTKELDISALTEIFETIFDLEGATRAVDSVISEQQIRLIHELEKTLSALWMGVSNQVEVSDQENGLLKRIQEMIGSLRHGLMEIESGVTYKSSFFSGYGALFAKRSLFRLGKKAGR